jgi:hypothetical protein
MLGTTSLYQSTSIDNYSHIHVAIETCLCVLHIHFLQFKCCLLQCISQADSLFLAIRFRVQISCTSIFCRMSLLGHPWERRRGLVVFDSWLEGCEFDSHHCHVCLQLWASCLLRFLSSFEWDVKPRFLVPGAYTSGKQKTPSKWETWVACDGLLPGWRQSH